MVVFLSALLPEKHKEQMLLFLTLGISARWVLWFPVSDTSVFLTLRSGYFREGAGGWDGWRSRRLHTPWAVWGLVNVGCQSCPQGLAQPGDFAVAATRLRAEPSPANGLKGSSVFPNQWARKCSPTGHVWVHKGSLGPHRLSLNISFSSSDALKTSTALTFLTQSWVIHTCQTTGGKLRHGRRASHAPRGREATQFQLFQCKLGPWCL